MESVYLELVKKPVKVGTERWYIMHVEKYVKSIPELKLLEHTEENLNQYFTGLARQAGIKDWILISIQLFMEHQAQLNILNFDFTYH